MFNVEHNNTLFKACFKEPTFVKQAANRLSFHCLHFLKKKTFQKIFLKYAENVLCLRKEKSH